MTQVQLDEMWSFIRRNVCSRLMRMGRAQRGPSSWRVTISNNLITYFRWRAEKAANNFNDPLGIGDVLTCFGFCHPW